MDANACICAVAEHGDSFMELVRSPAHWMFELMLMGIFDGFIGVLAWPFVRKHLAHHLERDRREGV